MNYPALAIEHFGFAEMLHSGSYWESFPVGFIGIYKKRINKLILYSKDGQKWKLKSIDPAEPIGLFGRVFVVSAELKCIRNLSLWVRINLKSYKLQFNLQWRLMTIFFVSIIQKRRSSNG